MSGKKKVLVTDRFSHDSYLTLAHQAFLDVKKTETTSLRDEDLSDVHGLVIRSRTLIDEAVFQKAKKLQVIVTATSGFDHIDMDQAIKWGVTVMHTPEANVQSAAQLTWSLALACAHKIIPSYKQLKAGEWKRDLLTGFEMSRKTYGIVGLGRIGRKVAEIAQAFDMKVIAYDPYIDDGMFREAGAERVAYEEILKTSDVLSYHVPKTSETKYMLNRSHFEYIHRGIILINTSRGSVMRENDLVEALENGWIGALGLDVFEKEPLPRTSKLLGFPNVVATPHCGANTTEAFAKASEQAALKIIRFFMDSTTSDTLPPKAAWYGAVAPWKTDS